MRDAENETGRGAKARDGWPRPDWTEWPGGTVAPAERSPRAAGAVRPPRARRAGVVSALAFAALGAALLWGRGAGDRAPAVGGEGAGPAWDVEITAAGARPAWALAFGSEAGVHLVRVPPAGAAPAERRRVAARLGAAEVRVLSLGRRGVVVSTASPAGQPRGGLVAEGRLVTLERRGASTAIHAAW